MDSTYQHYVAYPITAELRRRVAYISQAIRTATDPDPYLPEFVDVILELNREALEYFFFTALTLAGVEGFGRSLAAGGIATTQRAIGAVVRRVIRRLSRAQLLAIVEFMEQIVHDTDNRD